MKPKALELSLLGFCRWAQQTGPKAIVAGPEMPATAVFTTAQAPGALPNGSRIAKVVWEPGDRTALGTGGEVVGSIGPLDGLYGYFVRWDGDETPILVTSPRIAAVAQGERAGA